jgi:hypothetical protein
VDLEVEQGPRQSLVVRPLRAVMGPFVTRALSAVLDSSALGAEVLLDLSPAQGATPGSVELRGSAVACANDRGGDVAVRLGPDGVDLVPVDLLTDRPAARPRVGRHAGRHRR